MKTAEACITCEKPSSNTNAEGVCAKCAQMTSAETKNAVAFFLRSNAEEALADRRPSLEIGFEVTALSRAVYGWEAEYDRLVAEAEPGVVAAHEEALDRYEAAVREHMVLEWEDLKWSGMARLGRACRNSHLPSKVEADGPARISDREAHDRMRSRSLRDLRRWAQAEYVALQAAPCVWRTAFAVLTLRDVVGYEADHNAPLEGFEDSELVRELVRLELHRTANNIATGKEDEDVFDGGPSEPEPVVDQAMLDSAALLRLVVVARAVKAGTLPVKARARVAKAVGLRLRQYGAGQLRLAEDAHLELHQVVAQLKGIANALGVQV